MGYSLTRSRHEQGQLVFYDEEYRHRWIDAIGPNVVKYIDDFAASLYNDAWETTVVETGTGSSLILPYDSEGGVALFSPADADNDAIQIQSSNEGFKLTDNDPIYFGARWGVYGVTSAGSVEVFIGLSNKDTTLVTGGTSCAGFIVTDGSDQVGFYASKAASGTTQSILTTLTASVFHTTEFYWNGSNTLYCWIDGVAATSHTTQIASGQTLAVSISATTAGDNDGATNNNGVIVDWIRAIQLIAAR